MMTFVGALHITIKTLAYEWRSSVIVHVINHYGCRLLTANHMPTAIYIELVQAPYREISLRALHPNQIKLGSGQGLGHPLTQIKSAPIWQVTYSA